MHFRRFFENEEGAISADFAVVAAMVVGLGLAIMTTVGSGSAELASNVDTGSTVNSITFVSAEEATDETSYDDGVVVDDTDEWNGYSDGSTPLVETY